MFAGHLDSGNCGTVTGERTSTGAGTCLPLTLRARWLAPWAFCAAVVLCIPSPTLACNVPVFRYALEHWDADPYRAVVFHRGPLNERERQALCVLENTKRATVGSPNLTVEVVDLGRSVPPTLRSLWESQQTATLPWIVLSYPASEDGGSPAWSGPLTTAAACGILDSPARQQCLHHILKGDSLVWVLVECGDREKDLHARDELNRASRWLEEVLELPVLDDEDRAYLSLIPFKLSFATVTVRRDDPAEKVFVQSLLNSGPEEFPERVPLIFPVFGRGQVLSPIVPGGDTRRRLTRTAQFLLGACSCQIKRLNPGVDLLFPCDWSLHLAPAKTRVAHPVEARVVLPSLSPAPAGPALTEEPAEPARPTSAWRAVLLGAFIVSGMLVLLTGVWALAARGREKADAATRESSTKEGTAC